MRRLLTVTLIIALLIVGAILYGASGEDGGRLKVHVEQDVPASVMTVFTRLVDHENWKDFPGIDESEIIEEGPLRLNGPGTVRRVKSGGFTFTEEITAYKLPTMLGYRIIKSSPLPIDHDGAMIELTPLGPESTRAVWVSDGRVDLPIIGGLLGKLMSPQIAANFRKILAATAQEPPQ